MKDLAPILQVDIATRFLAAPQELGAVNPQGYLRLRQLYELHQQVQGVQALTEKRNMIRRSMARTLGLRFGDTDPYIALRLGIINAREFLDNLVHEFIPDCLRFPFTSDGVVAPTHDPLEILNLIWDPLGNDVHQALRRFEALKIWCLGWRFMLLEFSSFRPLPSQLRELTLWLESGEESLFCQDPGLQREAMILGYCQPNDSYRYSEQPTDIRIESAVSYRYILVAGQHIQTLYTGRTKSPHGVMRNTLLKSKAEIPIPRDFCGITFVFKNEKDYRLVEPTLFNRVFPTPDAWMDIRINGAGKKDANANSSEHSPPLMQFFTYIYGVLTEVQIFLYPNWFNRQYSEGSENHHLYRLSQVLQLLPLFFPHALYMSDWGSDTVQQKLKAIQLGRIRANRTLIQTS